MSEIRSAIVTSADSHSSEHLDHTFSSFGINPGIALHAFIIGHHLPKRRLPGIQYHLVPPVPDFAHSSREAGFRRLELIDRVDADLALLVDADDVLCLQLLPSFETLLSGSAVAACVEHMGARYVGGQGYTANFLNEGVMFWNIAGSRDIREEIVARGRSHFRGVADIQSCVNEILQTRHYSRMQILPCQYNYRAFLNRRRWGWPTVRHLDGVMIYHNAACIDDAKKLVPVKEKANLPRLIPDDRPLDQREQFWRRLRQRFRPWVIK